MYLFQTIPPRLLISIPNERLSGDTKNNLSKKQGRSPLKWNKKYSDFFLNILIH